MIQPMPLDPTENNVCRLDPNRSHKQNGTLPDSRRNRCFGLGVRGNPNGTRTPPDSRATRCLA
eukprot:6839595-Pyramimonas_sp.AAC.1